MRHECVYFELHELVCPEVYKTYGQRAWEFFDNRLLITLDLIRERLNRPIFINTWHEGGDQKESGFRCIQCSIVKDKIAKGELYVSAHMTGQAVDFSVQGMLAEEVRQWLIKNQTILPYPIRLEEGVSWVHLDCRDTNTGKIFLFKP